MKKMSFFLNCTLMLVGSIYAADLERKSIQIEEILNQISQKIGNQRLTDAKRILDNLEERHQISTKKDLEEQGVTNFQPVTKALVDLVRKYKSNQERGLAERIIKRLIELGADVQVETITSDNRKTGITLLDRAFFFEEPRIFKALFESGKKVLTPAVFYTWVNRREMYEGKTLMHFAVACQDANGSSLDPRSCADIYIALVNENTPQDIPDAKGETAMALRERLMKSNATPNGTFAESFEILAIRLRELATTLRKNNF